MQVHQFRVKSRSRLRMQLSHTTTQLGPANVAKYQFAMQLHLESLCLIYESEQEATS
ncbi:hypothetical protein KC19_6G210000 [Ceratodon purpureus]|uniref:Uncharacterized protein n=1 Tax=Ceratodon purpureus TaxID=3225 RepID=A0A8T0HJV0_CERPU|nr:hypothetical protein KC19_6G210000 [Ceratodon purpureus]